jgi:hypothetical protein
MHPSEPPAGDRGRELGAAPGVESDGERMSGQGKKMPGAVARETIAETDAQPGALNGAEAPAALPPARPILPVGGDAFDAWLQAELDRLYGQTLSEPVPDDLLRLVRAAGRQG